MTMIHRAVAVTVVLVFLTHPVFSQGTDLDGGVVTRVDVEKWADLALDVRDIGELAAANGVTALSIYLDGRNAENELGTKLSLHQLSQMLATQGVAQSSPNFLYHLYGLDDLGADPASLMNHSLYADNFVRRAIVSNPEQVSDALLVLNTWIYGTELLYKGVDVCQKLTVADNPQAFDMKGGGMDEFIALWIGKSQVPGSTDGYGLYALTQRAGGNFGLLSNSEAPVNSALKALYQEGAAILSYGDACTKDNPDSVADLWSVVQRMISQMTIPLMQLLIDALMQQDNTKVPLYALAVVPQVSQCRPSIFKRLNEQLLGNKSPFSKVQEVIVDLQLVYDCLGFTCDDVGIYNVDQLATCSGSYPTDYALAGYAPSTLVHPHAKIDLDILQVTLLTSLGSYSFAKYLYSFGRNSPFTQSSENDPYRLRTLKMFATSAERKTGNPFYTLFVQYYNDPNYANTAVIHALDGTGKWKSATAQQRAVVVGNTCSYQIMYMFGLAEMGDAVNDCRKEDVLANVGSVHSWDEVAAYLIGSLEGPNMGGSPDPDDGRLMWNLANKRAFQFQTTNSMGYSFVVSELEDLLYAGKGELDAFDCDNLEKTVDRIQHFLLIPIVQSTLRYAIINQGLPWSSTNPDLVEGETFALSVLPITSYYDQDASEVIRESMVIVTGIKPVQDGAQGVADAFYQVLDDFGIGCEYVGATQQVDACRLAGGIGSRPEMSNGSVSLTSTALALTAVGLALVAW